MNQLMEIEGIEEDSEEFDSTETSQSDNSESAVMILGILFRRSLLKITMD